MKSSIRSRSERRFSAIALAVLLGLWAVPAAAAEITDEAKAQAREKFTQGNQAYERGEFREALTAFDAAYKLAPLPGFLFNVAQCHRQLGAYERAAFFYRRYLSLSEKEPANAPMVKELIAEMDASTKPVQGSGLKEAGKKAVNSRTASTSFPGLSPEALPGTPMAEPEPSKSLARKWWVWAGAGAAVLVAGGIVYAATTPGQRPTSLGTIPGR
jgi:tetratricopeptide (TPR) repeat protein